MGNFVLAKIKSFIFNLKLFCFPKPETSNYLKQTFPLVSFPRARYVRKVVESAVRRVFYTLLRAKVAIPEDFLSLHRCSRRLNIDKTGCLSNVSFSK